jgi:hypothetical protein
MALSTSGASLGKGDDPMRRRRGTVVLEVVYALASVAGVSPAQMEALRQHKLRERDGLHHLVTYM